MNYIIRILGTKLWANINKYIFQFPRIIKSNSLTLSSILKDIKPSYFFPLFRSCPSLSTFFDIYLILQTFYGHKNLRETFHRLTDNAILQLAALGVMGCVCLTMTLWGPEGSSAWQGWCRAFFIKVTILRSPQEPTLWRTFKFSER